MGGLGNQMFQYAAGRRLSVLKNVPLKLDVLNYNFDKLRTYELGNFNINASFASEDEILALKNYALNLEKMNGDTVGRFRKRIGLKCGNYNSTYFQEKSFKYDKNIINLPDDVYIDGYWQSEKYFSEISDIVRQEFSFNDTFNGCTEIADEIKSVSSVSIHIRRGDYVTNLHTNSYHGICSFDYYHKAAEYISEKVDSPCFYVFSDDTEWVRNNLKLDYPMKIVSNAYSKNNIEDLMLMSLCKNHIIANSSFSWWGAWLGEKDNGIVIAPKKWFNIAKNNTRDLIPKFWKKM